MRVRERTSGKEGRDLRMSMRMSMGRVSMRRGAMVVGGVGRRGTGLVNGFFVPCGCLVTAFERSEEVGIVGRGDVAIITLRSRLCTGQMTKHDPQSGLGDVFQVTGYNAADWV